MAAASSMSGWASDASDASDKEESNKPYAGYRRTNSFDRFGPIFHSVENLSFSHAQVPVHVTSSEQRP